MTYNIANPMNNNNSFDKMEHGIKTGKGFDQIIEGYKK